MRVPFSWLRDFAPFDGKPAEIAGVLDNLGLVVESIELVGEGLSDVVVGEVLGIDPIPGADRIRKVSVSTGGQPVEVVCGAWNFEVGDRVPLAQVGAVLPGGFEIARRKMKGVVSNGMLCSGRELGLSEDQQGILVLEGAPEAGTPLTEALGIEADAVFDIAVEANRPDAWSIAGVARDLAARLGLPFAIPEPRVAGVEGPSQVGGLASVEVVDFDLCPRFTARVLTGVSVGPSPSWLARRLVLAGMRPLNNVVDASNYVMLELGQPTHPYDLDKLEDGKLRVRAARPGEVIRTLDGVERHLGLKSVGPGDPLRDCVICDAHDVPVGIGGVMGGAGTEISDGTEKVLLEAAYFDPMAIARTSKRLGLRSEASARFERGCDIEGIDRASTRLIELLSTTAGGSFEVARGVIDEHGVLPKRRRLRVRVQRVNAVLGSELDGRAIEGYLEPIGFSCSVAEPGVLSVEVPSFRPDTSREIDVIEEVARHHGYANLPRRRLAVTQVGHLTRYQRERRLVAEVLAGLGAHQAWTPSLVSPRDHERARMSGPAVELANPLSPDESVLRLGLLPGMLKALAFNCDRRQADLRLFEIGKVFPPPDAERVAEALRRTGSTVVDERELLAAMFASGSDDATTAVRSWTTLAEALGIEGIEISQGEWGELHPGGAAGGSETGWALMAGLHPTRSGQLVVTSSSGRLPPGVPLGVVGEIDPEVLEAFGIAVDGQDQTRVGWLEIDMGLLLGAAERRRAVARPVSRFPSSDIDLAFVVDDKVPARSVEASLRSSGGEMLEDVWLFDVYRGSGIPAGARSLAYRLRFCAQDRTLTDEEVGLLRRSCIDAVVSAHEARLR